MNEPPLSEEMLNAFVDRQLTSEERLRILKNVGRDQGLGQEICDRQRVKELVSMAYVGATLPPRPVRHCRVRPWRWWR